MNSIFICFNDQGSTAYFNLSQIISVYTSPSAHQVVIETTTRSEQHRYIRLEGDDAKDFLDKWAVLARGI